MEIYLSVPKGAYFDRFFPDTVLDGLHALGSLRCNETGRVLSETELGEELGNAEVCILLSWGGCPTITAAVLDRAPCLRLVATPAGSVAGFVTEEVYARGLVVCSSNHLMAKHVAEGTLAYMLATLRRIPQHDRAMRSGIWEPLGPETLMERQVGLVGLGTVGRHLLRFLEPFDVRIRVFDPYVAPEGLAAYTNVSLCSLEEVLTCSDIVSIHASRTPETYHLLDRQKLALLKDGVHLVNTARGALVDEAALADELRSGRIRAILDVFDVEDPLPADSPLLGVENVILQPHVAGGLPPVLLAQAMVGELGRYRDGEPLQYEIPHEQFRRMTR